MAGILVAVKDLVLASRIDASASAAGIPLVHAPRNVPLHVAAAGIQPSAILVDLGEPGVIAEIQSVKSERPATRVIGVVAHVRHDLIEAAEGAGADEVMTRGQLTGRLGEILLQAVRAR